MPMMPPHMMMQSQGGPAKPLFPSAIPTSSPGAPVVGADFKPISSGMLKKHAGVNVYDKKLGFQVQQ